MHQNASFKLSNDPLGRFSFFTVSLWGPFFQTPGRGGKNSVLNFLKSILSLIDKTTPKTPGDQMYPKC